MTALKELVITLKNFSDLENFYHEMETEGTSGHVPFRAVTCVHKRPISRNTHYLISQEEAEELLKDSRVEAISETLRNLGAKPVSHFSQTSTQWNRGIGEASGDKNWGLLRSTLTDNITNWTSNQTATIDVTSSGKNVDVVICDYFVFPSHPEFSGRVDQYDWFAQHNGDVWPDNPDTNYNYDAYDSSNNHATHVAGIVAGITQGWARDANILNIKSDFENQPNGGSIPIEYLIDYIRAYHNNKSVNPETGVRNPTLVNCSWSLGYDVYNNAPTFPKLNYQGVEVTPASLGNIPLDTGISGWATNSTMLGSFAATPVAAVAVGTTTASVTIDAPNGNSTTTGSVPASALTGRIAEGDYIVDTGGILLHGARIQSVDDTVDPIQFTIDLGGNQSFSTITNGSVSLYNSVIENVSYRLTTTGVVNDCVEVENTLNGSSGMNQAGVFTYTAISSNSTVTVSGANPQATGIIEGQGFYLSTVSGITGLSTTTKYYAFNVLSGSFQFADSPANATAHTPVSFSGTFSGSGTTRFDPTSYDATSISSEDDAVWRFTAPFSITFNGTAYTYINVSSNSYVTFGDSTSYTNAKAYSVGAASPANKKILISAGDRSFQKVFYKTTGTSGSREFRIRWEGTDGPQGGVAGSPDIYWEMVFFEATPNQIDVHVGSNSASRARFTPAQLETYGVLQAGQRMPLRVASFDADVESAIADGIIFVGAAGNDGWKIDGAGGVDYNNYIMSDGLAYYYHRGASPGRSTSTTINVGAIAATYPEVRATFSNAGAGVDIYAPGENIISAVYDATGGVFGVSNPNYPVGSTSNKSISTFSRSSNVATITTSSAHGLTNGATVSIYLESDQSFTANYVTITVTGPTTFTYTNDGSDLGTTSHVQDANDLVIVGYMYRQFSGTSTAAAQVSGVLALALETYPRMTQSEAYDYVRNYAQSNKLTDSGSSSYSNTSTLWGGDNLVLYFHKERQSSGNVFPKLNYNLRPASGMVYPRPRIFRSL